MFPRDVADIRGVASAVILADTGEASGAVGALGVRPRRDVSLFPRWLSDLKSVSYILFFLGFLFLTFLSSLIVDLEVRMASVVLLWVRPFFISHHSILAFG